MPDDQAHLAHGTDVTWKSRVGYTYEGTVAGGPDEGGYYDLLTGDGARANVHRDDIMLKGQPAEEDPDLTPEQRESLRKERARQHANARVTDAMQSVYATLREDAKRELAEEPVGAALDDLRMQAADIVVAEAESLREAIRKGIEDKR